MGRIDDLNSSFNDGVANADEVAAKELSTRGPNALVKPARSWTIGSLEALFLKEFPALDAEDWDSTGLVVGERAVPLRKAAFALDPTVAAVQEAAKRGANVLVTHHPPFLSAPDSFAPESSSALNPGAVVWAAIQHGVALMCFHTALDVSPRAARVLPGMLGLDFKGAFAQPLDGAVDKGYGQVCATVSNGKPMTLGMLAARCTAVFGRQPRVWGQFDDEIPLVVTTTGSIGGVGRAALEMGVNCVVCGEVKYHEALDLSHAGMALIELGHDVSELPLVALLAQIALKAGVPQEDVVMVDQGDNWRYPEAIRL